MPRIDDAKLRSRTPLTRNREDGLKKKLHFQTYDVDPNIYKRGLNMTKLANRTITRCFDQERRQRSSSIKSSKRSNSNMNSDKPIDTSTDNLNIFSGKPKYYPSHKRKVSNENKSKREEQNIKENNSFVKTSQKEGEVKKRGYRKGEASGENRDQNNLVGETKGSNVEDLNKNTAKKPFSEKSKKIRMEGDPPDFSERDFLEMNTSLIGYYDLLIERDEVNIKLLHSLKNNFTMMMEEFIKKHYAIKHYEDIQQQYNSELEKVKKEKGLLEFRLGALKSENGRLRDSNIRNSRSNNTQLAESFLKTRDTSLLNQELHDSILEEQKITNLLHQREELITFMRAKENKYLSLLQAIEAKGIDIEKIYKEDIQNLGQSGQTHDKMDRKTKDTPTSIQNFNFITVKTEPSYPKSKKNQIRSRSKRHETEKDEVSVAKYGSKYHQSGESLQNMLVNQNSRFPPSRNEPYQSWDRHFTQPSNSDSITQYSQSMYSSRPSQPDELSKVDLKAFSKMSANLENEESESPADLKGRMKLDLSTIQDKMIKQYHDEFMDKWTEFTSSWKRAMKLDKTFTHVET